ncbi:MAG: GNAT family N-acetyltransferase [Desulfobacula sp.]|jgi:ElaA protein|uniref:GNAT family N-acetyltransferase n=1 Tax=Desulfobacula sp. TaxID=2593537 RepID=UPI001D97563A|nr:GNAT family N-acetyltransferase [Desulfobacula sp.]MBT3486219.1 GNAT family N-acetyltransferase [Desulfobacula sp.]MBT3803579.1 GNAT family N-acetyltransferase [Desulfobacula sp.]MBT4025717.1 GNAT family N-acetyltransferase [Desulfobacula sp.]MBT4199187.1 GNAT family N-acetyltransferase [Desulfobacula sp.]
MIQIEWEVKLFKTLSIYELYELLKLRVDVFVVEQTCPYPEIDGKDTHPETLHLVGRNIDKKIVAYSRILPPGLSFNQASMGRVVVEKNSRGQGIFDAMLKKSLDQIRLTWPGENIRISAQLYLMAFYQSYGFEPVSESYLEDGILHIDMVKNSR